MEKSINIGIIGLGYWGKNILRNLYELNNVHVACDTNPEMIESRKQEFPSLYYTRNYEDILYNPKIKAVVIATPTHTHYNLTKRALIAGKDVLVEKPMALSVKEGEELVRITKEKRKILMIGHLLQYHPAIVKLSSIIQDGVLGKIYYIYSNRLNIGKLRVEENILWSFAPHDISVILMLLRQEPLNVESFGQDYLNKKIEDATLTILEFRHKVRAHIFVSWLHPYKEQKLVVVGAKAMAVFDDLTKEKLLIYPHKIEWNDKKIPVAHKAKHYKIKVDNREPLKEELRHFIECIKERKNPRTDGYEGLRVLRVLEAAEKCLLKKRNEG